MIAPRRLIGVLALVLSLCSATAVLAQVQGLVIRDRSIQVQLKVLLGR